MSGQAKKKFRSKFFRVGVEGDTSDGRVIERSLLEQMAATYDPKVYAARVWMEHFRSLLPDSPFRAYGDVLALKTEEVEINSEKKLALLAQIEPTDDLVKMVNVLKQKLFTSMEIDAKFAGTGKAYFIGLGVTDTPASLGTERLAFAAKHPEAGLFSDRKQKPENMICAAVEAALEFDEIEVEPSGAEKVVALLSGLAERFGGKEKPAQAEGFADVVAGLRNVAEHIQTQDTQFGRLQASHDTLRGELQQLRADHADLKQQLSASPAGNQPHRPTATGQGGGELTDC